jgi:hypothetical protein
MNVSTYGALEQGKMISITHCARRLPIPNRHAVPIPQFQDLLSFGHFCGNDGGFAFHRNPGTLDRHFILGLKF